MNLGWAEGFPLWLSALISNLYLVGATMLVAGFFGLIIGILLYATRRGGLLANVVVFNILNVIINIVRPIPFIVFIAVLQPAQLAIIHTSIGDSAVLFAMIIAASFAFSRLVEQNLLTIDPGTIEAARAMGASPGRIITTVLVPEALGPLILGYTFLFVGVVDMSALAGIVGGDSLGNFATLYGQQRFDYRVTLVATASLIILVQLGQYIGNFFARKALRR